MDTSLHGRTLNSLFTLLADFFSTKQKKTIPKCYNILLQLKNAFVPRSVKYCVLNEFNQRLRLAARSKLKHYIPMHRI